MCKKKRNTDKAHIAQIKANGWESTALRSVPPCALNIIMCHAKT